MKKLLLFILALSLIVIASPSRHVSADSAVTPEISGKYGAVYNIDYNTFVYNKNKDTPTPPAGTAKLMTGILATEHFKNNMDAPVTVSSKALTGLEGSAVLSLKEGETVTARDLIYSMLIAGCNDSANALAVEIGGSLQYFAHLMTQKAKLIGADSTLFLNPSGLDAPDAVTTASDASLITAYAMSVPGFTDICNRKTYTVPKTNKSDERTVYTKNFLLTNYNSYIYMYNKASGMSASYTESAGYCVISSVSDNLTYVCVSMGSDKDTAGNIQAYYDIKKLGDWALSGFYVYRAAASSRIVGELPVSLSSGSDHVTVILGRDIYALVGADEDTSDISVVCIYDKSSLTAPVTRGERVGSATVTLNGRVLGKCDLVAKSSVGKSKFKSLMSALKSAFSGKPFLIATLALTAVFGIFAFLRVIFISRKSKGGS